MVMNIFNIAPSYNYFSTWSSCFTATVYWVRWTLKVCFLHLEIPYLDFFLIALQKCNLWLVTNWDVGIIRTMWWSIRSSYMCSNERMICETVLKTWAVSLSWGTNFYAVFHQVATFPQQTSFQTFSQTQNLAVNHEHPNNSKLYINIYRKWTIRHLHWRFHCIILQ